MTLLASLQFVADPRMDRCKKYPLDFILLIVFTGSISGNSSWYELYDYAVDNQDDLKELYEKLTGRLCDFGIPSHDTLNRIFAVLDNNTLAESHSLFLKEYTSLTGKEHLCLDGKTMRGVKKLDFDANCHCVSAYSPMTYAVRAQVYTSQKTNEISALKELLTHLDLENSVVTIDAIGTQTELVEQISEKNGDYVLNVKQNQAHTKEEIESLFCPHFAQHIQSQESIECEHGRIEKRYLESIIHPLELEANPILSKWRNLRSVHKMTRTSTNKKTNKTTKEVAYYISSMENNKEVFTLIREHWAVESMHYMLDVFFKEDKSTKRAGNAAQNINLINKFNLTILLLMKKALNLSVPRLMKKLARMKPSEIIQMEL